ncbi:MAG: Gfo/Idh/MocA family oxidoreductase [Bacteroidota bacterium]|nr:Gfo/Idh/MocA family oxidoreductase [Bacteroidota bacterium]
MENIKWGIIGCGDVTEVKSGPAFNKVNNSSLVAVMRRDAEKAKDYALRHHVPKWYDDASALINDEEVNAIYIATPPAFHEEYTLAAFEAGKPVYLEKPMTLNYSSAITIRDAAIEKNIKLAVAHYRREQPLFKKVKQLLDDHIIGDTRFVKMDLYKKSLTANDLKNPKIAWRVNDAIAGGGLFHDLAPHQLDLLYYFFGEIDKATGYAINQAGLYDSDDMVSGTILFKSGVIFSGLWCFNVSEKDEKDECEITGSKGKINFSVFEHQKIIITINGEKEIIPFMPLLHVQQPMIEKVVAYFLGKSPNPCGADDGAIVMQLMDQFTGK